MDLPRKIGIGIVMLIPTFVGSGALYAIFHSLILAVVWVIIMVFAYNAILAGKLNSLFGARA